MKSAWTPILEAPQREQALAVVGEIVAALPGPGDSQLPSASLAAGAAELAILCAYLSRAGLDNDENAARFLYQAAGAVANEAMDASLYGGFTGIGWTMAHLREQLVDADDKDPNEAIDEVLLAYLDRSPWTVEYDLISGLVGLGVYALERLSRASARKCLERIVQRLSDLAERRADGGITWPTPPELLPLHQREKCPNGYYNLGLAHGVPGVIAFLGQVCGARIGGEKARALLNGGVAWLLKQKLPATNHSTFPAWVTPDIEPEDCRLAWCYGDAGVAGAMLVAARAIASPDWELEAIEIARRAAQRRSTAGVKDAALCHGAAGLGHIFNRFFQATGEASFRQAARYWFEHTLALRVRGEGVGGFSAYRGASSGRGEYWEDETGFLEGAVGIALALLAAAADIEPNWDRLLLVSASGANSPLLVN